MPAEVRQAIADVTARVGDRVPAMLIATADPYLPWELAVLDPELQFDHPDESPFLGARTAIGRWPLTGRQPPPKPVTTVTVKDRAIVAGSYVKVQGVNQLEAAEAEAAELLSAWSGAQEIEPTYAIVRRLLRGSPPADLLHFALHGQFQETVRNGLVLIATDDNGKQTPYYLQPSQIESGRLDAATVRVPQRLPGRGGNQGARRPRGARRGPVEDRRRVGRRAAVVDRRRRRTHHRDRVLRRDRRGARRGVPARGGGPPPGTRHGSRRRRSTPARPPAPRRTWRSSSSAIRG